MASIADMEQLARQVPACCLNMSMVASRYLHCPPLNTLYKSLCHPALHIGHMSGPAVGMLPGSRSVAEAHLLQDVGAGLQQGVTLGVTFPWST